MTKFVHRYKKEVKNKEAKNTKNNKDATDTSLDTKEMQGRQMHVSPDIKNREETAGNKRPRMLRIISPELHRYVTDELNNRHNIHPHDVQLSAVEENNGLSIIIRFGEDYAHAREMFFTHEMIREKHPDLQIFIQDMADECKDVLIADYFKMVKP